MADAAWERAGREHTPYRMGGFWYTLADEGQQKLYDYVYEYLAIAGPEIAKMMAESVHRHTPEAVLAAQPEVVVTASAQLNSEGEPDPADSLNRWKELSGMPATQHGHYVVLNADTVSRPAANMLQAVDALCAGIDKAR